MLQVSETVVVSITRSRKKLKGAIEGEDPGIVRCCSISMEPKGYSVNAKKKGRETYKKES